MFTGWQQIKNRLIQLNLQIRSSARECYAATKNQDNLETVSKKTQKKKVVDLTLKKWGKSVCQLVRIIIWWPECQPKIFTRGGLVANLYKYHNFNNLSIINLIAIINSFFLKQTNI